MPIKRNKRFHAEVATSSLSDIMFFFVAVFSDNIDFGKPKRDKNDVAEGKIK